METGIKVKSKRSKPYFCKTCLESDIDKFIDGRYSMCKKCLNLSRNKSKIKNEKEKLYETVDNKDVFLAIEKYLNTSYGFIEGCTVKELCNKITNFDKKFEKIEDNNIIIKREYIDIKEKIILKQQKEIESLKERIEKLEQIFHDKN